MHDDAGRDERSRVPGSHAGEQVGLGRVVEDLRATGSPDDADLEPGEAVTLSGDAGRRRDPEVQEASEESFPASDPPTFMSDPATPRDRDTIELPSGDDVP